VKRTSILSVSPLDVSTVSSFTSEGSMKRPGMKPARKEKKGRRGRQGKTGSVMACRSSDAPAPQDMIRCPCHP